MQTSPELTGIIESLLLTLFPEHTIFATEVEEFPAFLTEPALSEEERVLLAGFLNDLTQRPEWAERGALLREVTDSRGTRVDIRVPVKPLTDPGIGLYGPFATTDDARDWVRDHAPYQLESDVFTTPAGAVVELFRLV